MSLTRTLGGDRLGSGNKQKVHMHGYERSTHNLSRIFKTTNAAGTLIPFMKRIALPGDTWDITLDADVLTHPTVGPLFGSFKAQYDIFSIPLRLYNSLVHNNTLNIGRDMSQVIFPIFNLRSTDVDSSPDIDNAQINPSCLLKYLGISGVGTGDSLQRQFNAVFLLAYWDIYKNYYANKQEENGAVLHTPGVSLIETITAFKVDGADLLNTPTFLPVVAGSDIIVTHTGAAPLAEQIIITTVNHGDQLLKDLCSNFIVVDSTHVRTVYNQSRWGNDTWISWRYLDSTDINTGKPKVAFFPLENIDKMRENILTHHSRTTAFNIDDDTLTPYTWLLGTWNSGSFDVPNALSSQEGLALKTYQSDLFNNWLNTSYINSINERTKVSTIDGGFSIDALIIARKVYNVLNRIEVSGGTSDDWLDAVYNHDHHVKAETPMYMGGLSKEVVFQEITSTATTQSADGTSPLGTLAGRGRMSSKHKGGKVIIKVDEPSIIMGIYSLTPRLDYTQGNDWDVNLKTWNDLHIPGLDEIGFQDLITEQMAYWTTRNVSGTWTQKSAGKQPAWINYMTDYSQAYGNFAIPTNEGFMILNRRYEWDLTTKDIKDLTTYIDPAKFNFIFAETSLDAQNFWSQIRIEATVRRLMSAKVMPNL